MPGGGDFVSFFDPGAGHCTEKLFPGRDFDGKISGPGVSPGGW